MNLPSFSSFFNPAPANTTPAAPVTPPATSSVANPTDPFAKSTTPDPAVVPTSVLDTYKDLHTIDPKATPPADANADFITYNQETFGAQVKNLQFMQGEDVMTLAAAATKGDPAALVELVNLTAQRAYEQGAKLTATAANTATKSGIQQVNQALPNHLRSNDARAELSILNPALDHPAIAPMIANIQSQFERTNPTATGKQIAGMVNNFWRDATKATTPNQTPSQQQTQQESQQDFSSFFNGRG